MNTHRVDRKRRAPRVLAALALVAGAAAVALPMTGTSAAPPAPVTGPSNHATPGPTTGHPHAGTGSGGHGAVGQTFTAPSTGKVTSVSIVAAEHDDAPRIPSAGLTVSIHEVKYNGEPSTLLAGATIPTGTLAPTPTTQAVSFSSPAVVFAGRQYAIVLSTGGTCCYGWYGSSASYAGGDDWVQNGGAWSNLAAGDGNPDRLFSVDITKGFVDTIFGDTLVDADVNDNPYNTQIWGGGSVYAGAGVNSTRAALDMGLNWFPSGHLRALGSIKGDLNVQAASVWAGGRNVRLGSYSHVTGDVYSCGTPGDVVLDHNQRVDGQVRYQGVLRTPDSSAPFGWSLGNTVDAPCGGPADESMPAYAPIAGDYAGWTTITFNNAKIANTCLAQRTAAACNGIAPSSVVGALGFPSATQSAGLRIRVTSGCGTPVTLGPGNVPIAGHVHIVTGCQILVPFQTGITAAGPGNHQVVLQTSRSTGNRDISILGQLGSSAPEVSLLFHAATGEFATSGHMDIAGGGGAIYANRVRFYGNTRIMRSSSLINNTPTAFTFS